MNITKPQKSIYDMEKFSSGSIAVICTSFFVKGKQNEEVLQAASNELFRINDALRMRIIENNMGLTQYVHDFYKQNFDVLHFENMETFNNYADDYAKEPVKLSGQLCEIKIVILPDSYGLLVKIHHIISDAWTVALLATQFNLLLKGEKLKAYSYSEYCDSEKKYINSKRYLRDKEFFLGQLKQCEEPAFISEKRERTFDAARKVIIINTQQAKKIRDFAEKNEVSIFSIWATVLAVYMGRLKTNSEKFFIGTTVLNRYTEKDFNTAGMFINTVPVLLEANFKKTFIESLEKTEDTLMSVFRHQKYNYEDMITDVRKDNYNCDRLYDIILSYMNAAIGGADEGVSSTWHHNGRQNESLQINFDDRDNKGIFKVQYDYQTEKFTERDIENLHSQLCNLLFDALENPHKKIAELEMLSDEEKQKILCDFNNTSADYPRDKCAHQLFEEQVEKSPDKIAVVACDKTLTYSELNEEANRIASGLIKKGVRTKDTVLFDLSRKSHIFSAIFGILKVGAIFVPVNNDYPEERKEYIAKDSNASFVINESNISDLLDSDGAVVLTDEVKPEDPCYAIYTSGSTGNPKGTLITHRNVSNLANKSEKNMYTSVIKEDYRSMCSFATVGFDMFISESLLPLLNGMTVIFASEEQSNYQNKAAELFSKYTPDIFQCTPSKLKLLTANATNREYLAKVKSIIIGGESFDIALYDMLKEITEAEIYNFYGPTEATVWVTNAKIESKDDITIGKPMANTQIYIVDKYMNPVPIGVTGELCIAGDCVGAGYLGRPELTAEKFVDNPFGDGKLYKTGDLAYFREDGNIVFIGRNDFQVKIRGLRIELGEIENAISGVDGINLSVVVVRKNSEGRQLICAFYTGEEKTSQEIKAVIGEKLPKYMIPHIFIHLKEMPLTSSGKINRNALPETELENIQTGVEYVAPETEKEKVLTECIGEILNTEKVSLLDNFFDMGGDSLKAIELTARLESKGYTVSVKTIFSSKDIKSLAEALTSKETEHIKIEYDSVLPATAAQMRVYTAQMMNQESTLYNIPYLFKVSSIDKVKLQKAVDKLIERHESFRTHFENRNGEIVQVIDEQAELTVEEYESKNIGEFIRPFDMSVSPLFRVGFVDDILMIDMHHSIVDGESLPIFYRELNELYMGRELQKNAVQYGEFALKETDIEESEKYWLSVFEDKVPTLELNTDYPRQEKQTFGGSAHYDIIDISLHNRIKEKCAELGITPYVFYMASFNILLSKYSGNEDIVVGTPISGRDGYFLDTVGMFVNTVVLRSKPEGEKRVSDLLREIKNNSIAAIEHQNYPFGNLVKKLEIEVGSRNPLYDVILAYQSERIADMMFSDEKAQALPVPITTAKNDFSFYILPREDSVVVAIEYCTDLFRQESIEKMADGFKQVLEACLNEKSLIKDIEVMGSEEKQKLLYDFNNTKHSYGISEKSTLYSLFEKTASENKDKVCIKTAERNLTFGELLNISESLDAKLRRITEGKKSVIAVIAERSAEMYSAIYGIIRGGNAYLPIDPNYPQERIDRILSDSKAAAVAAQGRFTEFAGNVPVVDMTEFISDCHKVSNSVKCAAEPDDTAYVIYTSGSTGNPKGAMVSHKSAVNRILWMHDKYPLGNSDVILQKTPYTFDVSVWELFWWGICGGSLTASKPDEHFLPAKILDEVCNNKVTHLHFVPSVFEIFLNYLESHTEEQGKFATVKYVFVSGEVLTSNLVERFYKLYSYDKVTLHNLYGPTECAVDVTYYDCIPEDVDPVPIGKPIYNTQLYVVDKHMKAVPIGVTGELCIAGVNVGQGYLNNAELTAEKFIDNPFGEGKLYKTGDLAYFREDGNIVFIGRNDFQVKIRGLRIELSEIENAISGVDGINLSVVAVRKNSEGRQLICAFYTGEEKTSQEIKAVIGEKLPKYMIPHIFIHLKEMPLTSSGKINRKALPEIDLENIQTGVEYVAAETEKEKALIEAAEEVLGCEKVSILDNFFDLGGDSLKAIELTARLESKGYTVSVKTIFASKDIKSLAEALTSKETEHIKIEYGNVLPATAAQMRVYTSQFVEPYSAHYNVPIAFKVKCFEPQKLEKAVNRLIERHESLRTRFEAQNGRVVQIIEDNVRVKAERLSSDDISEFNTPFDLTKAPLIKVGYFENTIMLVFHHIIVDGESMRILLRDLNELYMGRDIGETVQYGEFAVTDGYTQKNEEYWTEIFKAELSSLELKKDFVRPEKQSFKGSQIYELIDIDLHNRITETCKRLNITNFVFYMACYNVLLSVFSGSEDIVVGTPINGRISRFLNSVGMFVNTIAMRSKPESNKKISELLNEIKKTSIEAIDNQNYPFDKLVKKFNLNTPGRNPLFDVMFAYQGEQLAEVVFGDAQAEVLPIPLAGVKCDMNFNIITRKTDVVLVVEYSTDLFKEKTVKEFITAYKKILEQALDENQYIRAIDVLTSEEKQAVLCDFNDTKHSYSIPEKSTLYSLFEKTASENKDKVCIKTAERNLTFGELLNISESLDARLRRITDKKKSVIAVIAERSAEMYSAIYGIIRGGNAYLPIDPNYPQERINYILSGSNAAAVVAQGKFTHLAENHPVVDMTEFIGCCHKEGDIEKCAAEPDDTAYVIYTSGSTGNPKGAMVSHKSAVNRILWMHDKYPLGNSDVILQKTPYTFDVSVWELFWWGICGGSLTASKPDEHFLPAKILDEVCNNKVTHLHFVPSVFEIFLNYLESHTEEQGKFATVKYVFVSGEVLTANLVERFYKLYSYDKVTLYNLYGPTECAVDVTYYDCRPGDVDPVPIGKPIYNTQMYVVDKHMKAVPIGVTGELCIAGVNVGQGYLNNPELTAEKFVDNPFGEGKLYKTGDNAYWRENGQLIFCGRIDSQIKLNGQRIEIGEIETAINSVQGVESAAVIVKKINSADVLIAFYTGIADIEGRIKEFCSGKLPKYMVPGVFVHLDKLPLNQSGKLDRKALSEIQVEFVPEKEENDTPATPTESFICEKFKAVLEKDNIGRNSDFFENGGTSLSMISVLSEKGFEGITAAEFMGNPTPARLAPVMDGKSESRLEYLEALHIADNSDRVLILLPFAGGGAEAYGKFLDCIKKKDKDISVYFIRYLHSEEECRKAAFEIASALKKKEISIYSHCVGAALALQIIKNLEEDGTAVKHYFAAAAIPPSKPTEKNTWRVVPDRILEAVLSKAGARIKELSAEKRSEMLTRFRKDTDFANISYAGFGGRIKAPVSVIISKNDIFTKNYRQAEKLWLKYVQNLKEISFISSESHYFQRDDSDSLLDIILGSDK